MIESLTGKTLGKVHLGRLLGEGAAGAVYLGHHTTLGIDVAVKVLRVAGDHREHAVYRERMRREAQLTARLDHVGLVRVLDYGEHEGIPFLVMDYVDGFSLADYLKSHPGPTDEVTLLKIVLAAAQALAVAHNAGIVHRDLKPSNLLISRKGRLKVADLGLARHDGMEHLTQDQIAVGTPGYIAPESLLPERKIDQRSDIYSLGVVAYRLAYGRKPYTGTIQQMLHGHLSGRARFDGEHRCGRQTIEMIKRMMALDAANRFSSCDELVLYIRESIAPKFEKAATGNGSGSSTGGSSGGLHASSDLKGIVRFLESRLGATATDHQGTHVVHTTAQERLLVWSLLAGLLAIAVGGYLFFG